MDTVIWHYFSLAKPISLLNNSTFHFTIHCLFGDKMGNKMSAMEKPELDETHRYDKKIIR